MADESTRELLSNITHLMHKTLDMVIKLLTSFRTGLINILSQQKLMVEKIKNIENMISRIDNSQGNMTNQIHTLSRDLDKAARDLEKTIVQQSDEIEKELRKLQTDQSNEIIGVLKDQLNQAHDEQEQEKRNKVDISKQKITSRWSFWATVLVALIGAAFAFLQFMAGTWSLP